jgi:hypothetical protein
MTMRKTLLLSFFLAGGCFYGPDLGKTPFLCNTDTPTCPRNYNCQPDQNGVMVCVQNGESAIPDAPPVNCADDSALEPNDTMQTAYATPLEGQLPMISYSGLSICPGTDIDTYIVDVTAAASSIDVEMTYEPGWPLTTTLLDVTGNKVADGAPKGENIVGMHFGDTVTGAYYVQVLSPTGHQNNYRIDITTF